MAPMWRIYFRTDLIQSWRGEAECYRDAVHQACVDRGIKEDTYEKQIYHWVRGGKQLTSSVGE